MIRLIFALLLMACPATASDFHAQVTGCLSAMRSDADWATCRAAMFSPCPTEIAGSPDHVACLQKEVDGWETYLDGRQDVLNTRLTSVSVVDLGSLMGQWRGYVRNKCAAVAAQNPKAAEAAEMGCRISEIAGLATELTLCAEGGSAEPYCILKDE